MSSTVIGGLPVNRILQDVECFLNYEREPEQGLPVKELMTYVVLLYTKESFLNKKPMDPLKERRVKAANIAGLPIDSQEVKDLVFDLGSEKIRDVIIEYMISQNQMLWTERCIVEAQIEENQRIRFKPIQNKFTVAKKDGGSTELETDDKTIIEASVKKKTLTQDFSIYYELLKKYDQEIFQDHDDVKSMVKKTRTTVESMAK